MRQNVPPDTPTIEQQLLTLAAKFVADHAGRATLETLKQIAKMVQLQLSPTNGYRGKSDADDLPTWERYLRQEFQRLDHVRGELQQDFTWETVEGEFYTHLQTYQGAIHDLQGVRTHFSGKRLLQALAQHWQLRTKSAQAKKPWEVLQDYLIEQVEAYSAALNSPLHNDPRLGDVGRLALKITDQFPT